MKNIIRLEEAAMLGISVFGLYLLHADWWYYLLLLLGPDVSMIGYAFGNHAGAVIYNLFHHKGIAIVVFFLGFTAGNWLLQVMGIILFGHSSMDRMLGYGLKYFKGFKITHLGALGEK